MIRCVPRKCGLGIAVSVVPSRWCLLGGAVPEVLSRCCRLGGAVPVVLGVAGRASVVRGCVQRRLRGCWRSGVRPAVPWSLGGASVRRCAGCAVAVPGRAVVVPGRAVVGPVVPRACPSVPRPVPCVPSGLVRRGPRPRRTEARRTGVPCLRPGPDRGDGPPRPRTARYAVRRAGNTGGAVPSGPRERPEAQVAGDAARVALRAGQRVAHERLLAVRACRQAHVNCGSAPTGSAKVASSDGEEQRSNRLSPPRPRRIFSTLQAP